MNTLDTTYQLLSRLLKDDTISDTTNNLEKTTARLIVEFPSELGSIVRKSIKQSVAKYAFEVARVYGDMRFAELGLKTGEDDYAPGFMYMQFKDAQKRGNWQDLIDISTKLETYWNEHLDDSVPYNHTGHRNIVFFRAIAQMNLHNYEAAMKDLETIAAGQWNGRPPRPADHNDWFDVAYLLIETIERLGKKNSNEQMKIDDFRTIDRRDGKITYKEFCDYYPNHQQTEPRLFETDFVSNYHKYLLKANKNMKENVCSLTNRC